MAVPAVVGDFLAVVRKSGLIEERKLLEVFPDPGSVPEDPQKIAAILLRSGLLTQFQAKQLLIGKFRGFMLGTYTLMEPIGKGGMGTVFLAEHTALKRKVAIKVLPTDKARDKLTLERFNREARAAAALDHSNIVRLHDISQGNGVHFIVMEYIDGNDLQALMAKTGPLHFAQAAHYVAMAAAGLQHAHEKGFVHRDIKPGNLMLSKEGTIKLLDMGLARSFTDEKDNLTAQLGVASDVAGTADYISPEQAMQGRVDERSDIYSLGATLFALVTGHPPFRGSTVQKLMQHQMAEPPRLSKLKGVVPPALSEVVAKMLEKKPIDRFQCAADVIDALAPWLPAPSTGNIAQDPITNSDMTPMSETAARRMIGASSTKSRMKLPQSETTNHKKWYIAGGVGLAVLLVSAILGGILLFGSRTKPEVTQNTNPNPNLTLTPPAPAQPQQKPAVNNASQPPKPTPKQSPVRRTTASNGVVYSSDFNALSAGESPASNKITAEIGPLPTGWKCEVYKANAEGIFRVGAEDGKKYLAVCDNKGEPGAQLKFELHHVQPDSIQANRQYEIRIECKSDLPSGGFVRIQRLGDWKILAAKSLAFKDGWQVVQVPLVLTAATQFQVVMGTGEVAPGKFLAVRKLEIIDVNAVGSQSDTRVLKSIQRVDLSGVKPFKAMFQDGQAKDPEWNAGLPEGVSAYCWKKESVAELRAEATDQGMAIGMTNLNNDLSAQLTIKIEDKAPLEANREYLARIEYRTSNDANGTLWVRKPDYMSIQQLELANTNDKWSVAEVTFTRPIDIPLHMLVANESAGEGNTLWVRKFELFEVGTK